MMMSSLHELAEPDEMFCSFFVGNGEAAVLACDELGVVPIELLHIPKVAFYDTAQATDEQASLRYNMKERFRQQLFRQLFQQRQKIILSGKVEEMWLEREMVMPDAPGVPDLSGVLPVAISPTKHNKEQTVDGGGRKPPPLNASDLDTQSDSDEDLEKDFVITTRSGRLLKVPPSQKQKRVPFDSLPPWKQHRIRENRRANTHKSVMTPQSASHSLTPPTSAPPPPIPPMESSHMINSGSLKSPLLPSAHSPKNIASPRGAEKPGSASSSKSASKRKNNTDGPFPHTPKVPPIAKKVNPRTLAKEEQFLRQSLQGLQEYAKDFQRVEKQEWINSANTPRKLEPVPATPVIEPQLPMVGGQTRKHVEALVRNTMVEIAESALLAQRTQELKEEDDEDKQSKRCASPGVSIASSLRQPMGQNTTTPAEWRQRHQEKVAREEEERRYEMDRAERQMRRFKQTERKAERALASQRHRFQLVGAATSMKHQLATERRECIERSKEVKTARTLAQRDQRRLKATLLGEQKRAVAYINRVAHEQLRSLRTKLKDSVGTMSIRKKWEVPDEVRDMFEQGDGGVMDDDSSPMIDIHTEGGSDGGGDGAPSTQVGSSSAVDQY